MISWGVNSWNRADTTFGGTSLFDIVKAHARDTVPGFWGRYIGEGPQTSAPILTRDERDFIFETSGHMCRILLIYNGVGGTRIAGTARQGRTAAWDAADRAKDLGAPPSVRIFLNVEPTFRPSSAFFEGWLEAMHRLPFAGMGGVYMNPDFHYLVRPWFDALRALSPVGRRASREHWSTRPGRGCDWHPLDHLHEYAPRRMGQRPNVARPNATPVRADPVTVWQYARNCIRPRAGARHGLVDLNLATAEGMKGFWASPRQPAHIAAAWAGG